MSESALTNSTKSPQTEIHIILRLLKISSNADVTFLSRYHMSLTGTQEYNTKLHIYTN